MANNNQLLPPDYSDPYQPPTPPERVKCLHCEKEYISDEMKWDGVHGFWSCKYFPKCDGAGYGVDIFDVDFEQKNS